MGQVYRLIMLEKKDSSYDLTPSAKNRTLYTKQRDLLERISKQISSIMI